MKTCRLVRCARLSLLASSLSLTSGVLLLRFVNYLHGLLVCLTPILRNQDIFFFNSSLNLHDDDFMKHLGFHSIRLLQVHCIQGS